MSVMVLQGRKSSPQKSRPPESGHRRHGVWIAIEYSSCAYQAGFRRSGHISLFCMQSLSLVSSVFVHHNKIFELCIHSFNFNLISHFLFSLANRLDALKTANYAFEQCSKIEPIMLNINIMLMCQNCA